MYNVSYLEEASLVFSVKMTEAAKSLMSEEARKRKERDQTRQQLTQEHLEYS